MPRVLIVDDNDLNREVIVEMVEDHGCSYDEAENGLVALELASNNNYDLILMDIMMPVMDGMEATRKIRAQQSPEEPPRIIAVTAKDIGKHADELLTTGFDSYVKKPFSEQDLMTACRMNA